ncbi:MAG: TIGR02117 family protein [Leptolyngbyaceae cyanobacterium bins.349]|nr:TIGR02117 family protein [Leptolyngbyaceae cyanobacterium bins.349]
MKIKVWCKRAIAYTTVSIAGLAALLAIAAVTPRKWSFPANSACEFPIYISSDGFHTNFFIPVETTAFNWRQQFNLDQIANRSSQAYRYLQFGWGDRIFYIETPSWEQVRISNALRALFYWQNQSALFIKGHPHLPQLPEEQMKCVKLSRTDYLALMQFIQNTFEGSDRTPPQRLASGQDQESGFFAAQGHYSILNTCNSWTANGLRAANVNTPLWAGLAQPIMLQLRNGCSCSIRE